MPPLTLITHGDANVTVTRRFAAPSEHVYRAHLEPDLIRQWIIAMPGWSMPICETDSQVGGEFHFAWDDGEGGGFAITGQYILLDPNQRIEHVERMHIPDPTPDNHIETTFEVDGAGTLLALEMTLPDSAARQEMLDMGAADGMDASYAMLDAIAF